MSDKRRDIRKAKRTPGESDRNARERARQAAEQAARRKKERKILILSAVGLLVLALVAGVGIQLWRYNRAPEAEAAGPNGFQNVSIQPNTPVMLGKAGAKVTLTVYSDFLCPHCQDFEEQFSPTLAPLQNDGTLQIQAVPMGVIDPQVMSPTLANAFACAVDENYGQQYYSALFANSQLQWTDAQLVALGKQVNPNMPASFETCVTRKKHWDWTQQMDAYAAARNVTSTPTLFLNDKEIPLSGLTPDSLKQQILAAAG